MVPLNQVFKVYNIVITKSVSKWNGLQALVKQWLTWLDCWHSWELHWLALVPQQHLHR